MKLSWTFYPKHEQAITLEIIYLPELDAYPLDGGGFLMVEQNRAFVNWETFRRFDDASVKNRADAYSRLVRLNGEEVTMDGKLIALLPSG